MRKRASLVRPRTPRSSTSSESLTYMVMMPLRAASMTSRGGPDQIRPEITVFVSATIFMRGSLLGAVRRDLVGDIRFAEFALVRRSQAVHNLAQAIGLPPPQLAANELFDGVRSQQAVLLRFLGQLIGQRNRDLA